MTNIEFFEYSGKNPEPIIDAYYNHDTVIIPTTCTETNALVEKNARLIELISVFSYLYKKGKTKEDAAVKEVLAEVCEILVHTEGINFSPLSQFFMVYNSSYSSFLSYSAQEKLEFLYMMLTLYVQKRHIMYTSHGYTNTLLQVVCDNYSHKRKSKATIVKVSDLLKEKGFEPSKTREELERGQGFILPDKGDEKLFAEFRHEFHVELACAKNEQDKLPDMVFALKGHYYIVEMKTMKGSGGGQDKQLTEIINFIRYKEQDERIHYITYLDGEYSNLLHGIHKQPKIQRQYDDIMACLRENSGNYFLNTAGFKKFIGMREVKCL